MTARTVIDRLGGIEVVRRSLGISRHSTVQSWAYRNFIPGSYFVELVDLAKERGVELTFEELAAIAAGRRKAA